jgi:hypothetical protein
MERTFQQAPAQIQEQYGQEFIKKASALAHQHLASAANSPHVEWVVDVYVYLLNFLFIFWHNFVSNFLMIKNINFTL